MLPWIDFAASLQNATNTIVENQRVITKVYFPRLVLPHPKTLSGLVDFGVSFMMFLAMMAYSSGSIALHSKQRSAVTQRSLSRYGETARRQDAKSSKILGIAPNS
jgi:hypothetical protein